MNTHAAKTIEMQSKSFQVQEFENLILQETLKFVEDNDLFIKDLSDSICTLLDDEIIDSKENNAYKAKAIASTISFICEQRNNMKNLNYKQEQSYE